jgi:uncharacterized RDD family membrane protein YckC
MAERDTGGGLRGSVRRAVGEAFDATVGRVGDVVGEAALDVTGSTAQQVIEELEPYLIAEAIPRIVDGITPYLAESVVPEVLEGVHGHLVEVTVPEVVDGVTAHLVAVTVPEVVAGVTPRLVEDLLPRLLSDLRPYLEQELAPHIVAALLPEISTSVAPDLIDALMPTIQEQVAPQLIDALMPKIEAEVAPRLVESLMPMIREQVAPDLIDALMPTIQEQVAPDLIDALMPKIEQEVAPQLIDAVLPKIRTQVVPTILDDIVDDPRVRDLIREQSQGLFLDAFESLRKSLADADNIVENVVRRLLRRKPRPLPESGLQLVMDASSSGQAATRLTLGTLEEQRALWQAMPAPPAPPGRDFAHAGIVTRGIALAIDVSLTAWLIGQGLSALISLLGSVLDPIPSWLTGMLTLLSVNLVPLYLAVAWTWLGRSLGSWVVGVRICTPDGRRLGIVRAAVRAWLLVFGVVIWVWTGFVALFDGKRRIVLDRLVHSEERYLVPDNQQRRYLRDAVMAEQRDALAAAPSGEQSLSG